MLVLNVILGLTAIAWIVIGIKTHADWVVNIFDQESRKIKNQQIAIEKYGYQSISSLNVLSPKKAFVFGYWDGTESNKKQKEEVRIGKSPLIFQIVNGSLIAFTSIAVLTVLSRGLFTGIGLL
tara:strand:- start:448 stop:816 length:369 start_codon:yes stop_codon:yes gene_type:complete